jgi:hypothetical protein
MPTGGARAQGVAGHGNSPKIVSRFEVKDAMRRRKLEGQENQRERLKAIERRLRGPK